MKSMNIVILSGGTGNTAILQGIKKWYPKANVSIIVNAYDDGKSTGICRDIVNTLGVSDVRKNHEKILRLTNPTSPYLELYSARYDLPKGKEEKFVLKKMKEIEDKHKVKFANDFKTAVKAFFSEAMAEFYTFKDFNIMNIIYSAIWSELGYDSGNYKICSIIGIEDNVILNTYNNVHISARTKKGKLLVDEGHIVDFCNNKDYIKKIHYDVKPSRQEVNPLAVKVIEEADLIIVSTGTFWSSILPTIEYGNMYEYLNKAKAKKIWVVNSTRDKDSWAEHPYTFLSTADSIGLDSTQWIAIYNLDSPIEPTATEKAVGKGYHLGMIGDGKNDPYLVGRAIFDVYFGIPKGIQQVLVDFDGTISSSDCLCEPFIMGILAKMDNVTLITGNTLDHIKKLYGEDFIKTNKIWANANSEYFVNGRKKKILKSNRVRLNYAEIKGLMNLDITPQVDDYCVKFKPLYVYRKEICDEINEKLEANYSDRCLVARCTGKTTIDILNKANNKGEIYYKNKYYKYKTLYIGDELEDGNDKTIASLCDYSINVNNPYETGIIFRLLQ